MHGDAADNVLRVESYVDVLSDFECAEKPAWNRRLLMYAAAQSELMCLSVALIEFQLQHDFGGSSDATSLVLVYVRKH